MKRKIIWGCLCLTFGVTIFIAVLATLSYRAEKSRISHQAAIAAVQRMPMCYMEAKNYSIEECGEYLYSLGAFKQRGRCRTEGRVFCTVEECEILVEKQIDYCLVKLGKSPEGENIDDFVVLENINLCDWVEYVAINSLYDEETNLSFEAEYLTTCKVEKMVWDDFCQTIRQGQDDAQSEEIRQANKEIIKICDAGKFHRLPYCEAVEIYLQDKLLAEETYKLFSNYFEKKCKSQ